MKNVELEGGLLSMVFKILSGIAGASALYLFAMAMAADRTPHSLAATSGGFVGAFSMAGAALSLWWFAAVLDLLEGILNALRGGGGDKPSGGRKDLTGLIGKR